MSIKVGINGFGRIGRMVLRCSLQHPEIEIVGINDLCPADYLAYMLKYDTMHGRFQADVSSSDKGIIVNGRSIPVYAERDPANLPWKEIGAEYGDRNHSTVLSSIRKVEEMIKEDPMYSAAVRDITSNINSQ